jgi:hypothetical protein
MFKSKDKKPAPLASELKDHLKRIECVAKHCNSNKSLEKITPLLTKLVLGQKLSSAEMKELTKLTLDRAMMECETKHCGATTEKKMKKDLALSKAQIPNTAQGKAFKRTLDKAVKIQLEVDRRLKTSVHPKSKQSTKLKRIARKRSKSL